MVHKMQNSGAKFYLRKKDKKGYKTIYLYVTCNGKQVYCSTGIRIKDSDWDTKRQRAKKDNETNYILLKYAQIVDMFFETVRPNAIVSNEELKLFIDSKISGKNTRRATKQSKGNQSDFFTVIDNFIREAPNRLNADGERIGDRRVKIYVYERQTLAEFERKNGRKLSFEGFDYQILSAFQTFLTSKNLANNTVVRYFKVLHVFLRHAEQIGIQVNQDWRKYRTVKQNKRDSVVLTDKEIEKVWNFQTDNECEDNIKKLFIIGVHTGLRFGDFSQLKESNIDFEHGTISKIMNKTGRLVTIPLHPRLAQILKKEKLPHKISVEKFNKYIKQFMKKVGLNEIIQVKKIIGGKRIVEYHPKWELVSSHTCRRSFATNLYKAGVNPSIVMMCTGHRDLQSFMRYIVLSDEDKLQVVRNIWSNTSV